MASRRCIHALTRRTSAAATAILSSAARPRSLGSLSLIGPARFGAPLEQAPLSYAEPAMWARLWHSRLFSSGGRDGDSYGEDEEGSEDEAEDDCPANAKDYSPEEMEAEAAAIGYKVVGPLQESENVFKPYEPVFAVVQIGSHQFKVSNGDSIFTEKLKFCDVNDKLVLNKVLMLGSKSQTIVGRPVVPEAAVHAVVEEHALDAKVIIFKKKKRKNYRRTKGHRQELTKLRITDIQGIEKPEATEPLKPVKIATKKPGKVAVAA